MIVQDPPEGVWHFKRITRPIGVNVVSLGEMRLTSASQSI
jgi:hypothetical protein